MRGDVQSIFKTTPHKKQVLHFSATMPKDIREICRKFMNKVSIASNKMTNQQWLPRSY